MKTILNWIKFGKLDSQKSNFVNTDFNTGITDEVLNKALEILK